MNQSLIFSKTPDTVGGNKNLYEINKYVRPALNQIGFDCISIPGRTDNVQKVFEIGADSTTKFLSQIFYVQSVKEVPSKSRISIPPKIVNSTSMDERVKETLFYLGMTHIWLFVSVRTHWYILVKYADIPAESWNLFFRHKPGDRMSIKAEYLTKMVRPYNKLEIDIQNILDNVNK